MAVKSKSFGDEVNSWKLCLSGHKNNAANFAFLAAERKSLETLIGRAEKENAAQEKLKADLKAQSEVLEGIRQKGRETYASLLRYAKAKYGPNSAKISEFVSKTEGTRPKKTKNLVKKLIYNG